MLFFEDLISAEKLFPMEENYMPASNYFNNTEIVEYRQKLIKIIKEVPALLSFKIRYAAISYFDRYASRQETSVVLGKDCELLAFTCLITAAKVEKNDIFIYDLACGKLLERLQAHILSAQVELLKVLDWRIRPLVPVCFIDYMHSLLYEQSMEFELSSDMVEQLLFETQNDIAFTKYRPSIVAAALLLLIQPVENYEHRLAHCALDTDSLYECIEKMKTLQIAGQIG